MRYRIGTHAFCGSGCGSLWGTVVLPTAPSESPGCSLRTRRLCSSGAECCCRLGALFAVSFRPLSNRSCDCSRFIFSWLSWGNGRLGRFSFRPQITGPSKGKECKSLRDSELSHYMSSIFSPPKGVDGVGQGIYLFIYLGYGVQPPDVGSQFPGQMPQQ